MLFICGQSFISGGEQVLKSTLQNLKTSEPQYLICKDEPKIRDFFNLPNTKLIPFKYFLSLSSLKDKFGYGAYPIKVICNLHFAFFLLKVILKLRPKVIISNNFSEMPFSVISYCFNIPFVQYVHEIIDRKGKVGRTAQFFQKYISKFICVSKSSQNSMLEVLKSDKTILLYNSTDLHTDMKAKNLKVDPIEFVFIGMLNSNKNPMRFLEWIKLISANHKVSARIVYHIFDPDLLSKAKTFCEEHNLPMRWFHGASSKEIKDAISEASFVCITSNKEALSLVALQALSLGTPVITTENGGVPELIQDGYNGFVVNEDSQIVTKLEKVLREGSYPVFSENCLKESIKYSHELHAEKFARIIEDLK